MITKMLGWILLYSLIVYATLIWWPWIDFYPMRVSPAEATNNIFVFLILGFSLRIAYDIIRYFLKIATIPINRFTLWWLHIILNIAVLYLIPFIVWFLYPSITITMWTIVEVALFSLWFWIIRSFIK